jgi:hypothetical protein
MKTKPICKSHKPRENERTRKGQTLGKKAGREPETAIEEIVSGVLQDNPRILALDSEISVPIASRS